MIARNLQELRDLTDRAFDDVASLNARIAEALLEGREVELTELRAARARLREEADDLSHAATLLASRLRRRARGV